MKCHLHSSMSVFLSVMTFVGIFMANNSPTFAQSNQPIVYTYNSSFPPHAPASDNFGHSFSYDANGNQTSIVHGSSAVSMSYNHLNKLRSVQNGLAPAVEYRYDNSGTKTAKVIGGVIAERYFGSIDIKNGIKTRYYFMGGRRIAERKMDGSGSIQFYQPDHLSSTSLVTNQNGAEVHRADYYEFGAIRKEQGSETKDYAYNDKRRERETDFYDYGARAYEAKFMKFSSPDSIVPNPGNPQHLNRYAYVNNNPMKYTDPSGHFAVGLANSLYSMTSQAQHYTKMMNGPTEYVRVEALAPYDEPTWHSNLGLATTMFGFGDAADTITNADYFKNRMPSVRDAYPLTGNGCGVLSYFCGVGARWNQIYEDRGGAYIAGTFLPLVAGAALSGMSVNEKFVPSRIVPSAISVEEQVHAAVESAHLVPNEFMKVKLGAEAGIRTGVFRGGEKETIMGFMTKFEALLTDYAVTIGEMKSGSTVVNSSLLPKVNEIKTSLAEMLDEFRRSQVPLSTPIAASKYRSEYRLSDFVHELAEALR